MAPRNQYETAQLKEITAWKASEPGIVSVVGGKLLAPLPGWPSESSPIRGVSRAARRYFQERWLIVNGKLLEENPPTAARGSRGSAKSKTQATPALLTT